MTEQQALYFLKNNEEKIVAGRYIRIKAVAINALEKQIPKKPIAAQNDGFYCDGYYCPVCNERVDDDGRGYQQPYCYNCGQAILWPDKEKGLE